MSPAPDKITIPVKVDVQPHQELASLGGHLLATYGADDDNAGPHIPELATLGGYLLAFYSNQATPTQVTLEP